MANTLTRCEFCGAELEAIYINSPVRTNHQKEPESLFVGYRDCGCAEAVKRRAQADAKAKEAKRLEIAARRIASYERAGIPPKFIKAETNDGNMVARLLNGKSLYIHGSVGTGKTYYAMALAKRVINAGKTVRVTSASKIKSELFSTFGAGDATEEALFNSLRKPFLLVVDDLGKEHDSKAAVSMIYRLFNERDEQRMPVLVTSNFSEKKLYERLAESGDESAADSIVSRIHGMCGDDGVVRLDGEDRRMMQ